MSSRDDRLGLRDMRNHAREAVDMLGNSSREELKNNRMLQLALTHLVEIVGEAANRVSREAQKTHHQIPWPFIIGMRNRLIHGYDLIDLDLLYDTITQDLLELIVSLELIIGEGE
ncbi:MAG: HepT-like ribonuclease domain-containing protein [bacterium]